MRKAQSFANYSILLVIVAATFFGMSTYIQRGIQGRVAALSDAMIAPQEDHVGLLDETLISYTNAFQSFSSETQFLGDEAQRQISATEAISSSYTETTDEDYIPD